MVPVTAEVRGVVGHDHKMKRSGRDGALAPRTDVGLAGGVGLNGCDGDLVHRQAKIAHTTTATVTISATTTIAMSNVVCSCWRNGLSPMVQP